MVFSIPKIPQRKIWGYKAWFDDGLYIIEELALKIIMHCKIVTATEFRSKLGFNQLDITMPKEQLVLKSKMVS